MISNCSADFVLGEAEPIDGRDVEMPNSSV
jgi:hypothetical protein